jgi:hypothetical protein
MFGVLRENHPRFGKTHSEETKSKMSESSGTAVKVMDLETAVRSNYVSMTKAAEAAPLRGGCISFLSEKDALGVSAAALSKRFKQTNCFILKGRYQIEKK